MVDTSLKYALRETIIEFNEWAQKLSWSKVDLNEMKGILLNKLYKNLKSTEYRHVNGIHVLRLEVVENKIKNLIFTPVTSYSNHSNPTDEKLSVELNKEINRLDLDNIVFDELKQLEKKVDLLINNIRYYKI
jgi:hypothetical protein